MSKNWKKDLKYKVAQPVLRTYLSGLLATAKRSTYGMGHLNRLIADKQPFIPCYWHQQNICSAAFLLDMLKQDVKIGFLVSPSRDGEVPAKEFVRRGAAVIRGSSSRTGASAMRDLYQVIKQDGVSPANTPDGPRGPIYEFKSGALMLSQMTGAPVVPMAAACSRYWQFNSWDKFILPKWFSRMSLVIGEPVYVEKKLPMDELEQKADDVGKQMMQLTEEANRLIQKHLTS